MSLRRLLSQEAFWNLFVASFVALFFEALLIRWLPTSIYYLGYFKNSILIATFLGFGIGCATRVRVERVLPAFTLICATMVGAVLWCERILAIVPWQSGEFLWEHAGSGTVSVSMHAVLIASFIVAALLVMPLGRLVGMHLRHYRPLVAYSINLTASILGVAAFIVVSFLRFGPEIWFAIGLLPLLYLVRRRPPAALAVAVGVLLIVGVILVAGTPGARWSPYSKITLQETPLPELNARMLLTNNVGHQVLYDLSPRRLARSPLRGERERPPEGGPEPGDRRQSGPAPPSRGDTARAPHAQQPGPMQIERMWKVVEDHVAIYESAYALHSPRSVLIIGGGTGNEAAAALRRGARQVDMVEIDPVIIDLGEGLHPERPFDDPRVRVINDDARHFMATTGARYDLIIFGFLDSTSYLSSLSNIRLDNYVYTLESFRRARDLLNQGGLLQVTYYAIAPFVRARIYMMLRDVFGIPPLLYTLPDGPDDYIYFTGPVIGKVSAAIPVPGLMQMEVLEEPASIILPIDDWPFMNLPSRRIGRDHLIALGIMVLLSATAIRAFLGGRMSGHSPFGRLTVLFLLGVAFMLLETCAITRMALILGSTWLVTQSAVILVLLASLASCQLILRYRRPTLVHGFVLLQAGALLNLLVPMDMFQHLGPLRMLAMAGMIYLPILGSSIVFGRIFADSPQSDADLGVNILGAVFGGVLEYASLMVGISNVYLIVMAIFLLIGIMLMLQRGPRAQEAGIERPTPGHR
jgi:hypothetical protein